MSQYHEINDLNRWYDHDPVMKEAIEMLLKLPFSLQLIISEGVLYLINKECEAHKLMRALKSVGPDKTLSLFKSQNKRREYDANPHLYNAINFLIILSEDNQHLIAAKTKDLLACNMTYFKMCKELDSECKLSDVAELTSTFVEKGNYSAIEHIHKLKEEFLKDIEEASQHTKISALGEDLKVTGE